MPDKFDPDVYDAFAEGKPPAEGDFSDWKQIGTLLDKLSPEARCNAVYADWIIHLNRANSDSSIQVRDQLIAGDALSANYLAELAQNANDARREMKGRGTIKILADDGWLMVANNGARVSGINLLGLCRFFVHAGAKIMELDEETIGKFGIGFKSCHLIADEVIVCSWDSKERIDFRLPISSHKNESSRPDEGRLELICAALAHKGQPIDPDFRPHHQLGHCTPEFINPDAIELPTKIQSTLNSFRETNRCGTAFCLRLTQSKMEQVNEVIQGQGLRSLFPLFLPRISSLAFQESVISTTEHKAELDSNQCRGRRVTLEIASGSTTSESFWLLERKGETKWSLAIPCDSDGRCIRSVDRQFATQGAFAYFPLRNVTWKQNSIIHIDLPTDLPRAAWSSDKVGEAAELAAEAARTLLEWLDQNRDNWHPDWEPSDVIHQEPSDQDVSIVEKAFFDAYTGEGVRHNIFRTLWGSVVEGTSLQLLEIDNSSRVAAAWKKLGGSAACAEIANEFPIAIDSSVLRHFKIAELNTQEASKLFEKILSAVLASQSDSLLKDYVEALIGSQPEMFQISLPQFLERGLRSVPLELAEGGTISLEKVVSDFGATRKLKEHWHQFFSDVERWVRQSRDVANLHVFENSLVSLLGKLASVPEQPTSWEEIIGLPQVAFEQYRDLFWAATLPPCPDRLTKQAIQTIHVDSRHGDETIWSPLSQIWLKDEGGCQCFAGLIQPWLRRKGENNSNRLKKIKEALVRWQLYDTYEEEIEKLAEKQLAAAIADLGYSKTVGLPAWSTSKSRLVPAWRALVDTAELEARKLLIEREHLTGKTVLAPGFEPRFRRPMVGYIDGYIVAPSWLNKDAAEWLGVRFLDLPNRDEKIKIGDELLSNFYRWAEVPLAIDWMVAAPALFAHVTANSIVRIQPNQKKFVGDFVNFKNGEGALGIVAAAHSESFKWRGGTPLPEGLSGIDNVASKAIDPSILTVEVSMPTRSINRSELAKALLADPDFANLENSDAPADFFYATPGAVVSWMRGDVPIAELKDARFVRLKEGILVTELEHPPDLAQFDVILALYANQTPEDSDFQDQWQNPERNSEALYARVRDKVQKRLLKTEVTGEGYRAQHILRELLQNAESAYLSRYGMDALPNRRPFKISVSAVDEIPVAIEVSHVGRKFNEPDYEGRERQDIQRLRSIGAELDQTPEEVGRFNRGFKSVFNVTKSVEILSGGFTFTLSDIILLSPSNPTEDPSFRDRNTLFRFSISTKKSVTDFLGLDKERKATIFSGESFVFLKGVNEIKVTISGNSNKAAQIWKIDCVQDAEDQDWQHITITGSDGTRHFRVHSSRYQATGAMSGRRYGAAFETEAGGRPILLEERQRKIYLTLPTEDPFKPAPFLINGDFEADKGRLGIRNEKTNQLLKIAAIQAVFDRTMRELQEVTSVDRWLAWLNLTGWEKLRDTVESEFPDTEKRLLGVIKELHEFLVKNVPYEDFVLPARSLVFPTGLMRKIQDEKTLSKSFGFDASRWVDKQVSDELFKLPEALQPERLRLVHWVKRKLKAADSNDTNGVEEIRGILHRVKNQELARGQVENDELHAALGILPTSSPPITNVDLEPPEPRGVDEVADWWMNHVEQARQYTLDGDLWSFLGLCDNEDEKCRARILRGSLQSSDSPEGQMLWYRLLSLACLLGIGRTRTSTTLDFWRRELEERNFFDLTEGKGEFSGADPIFKDVIHQPFKGTSSSGENAEHWRRVFYDVRKIHHLIYHNEFATTLGDVIASEDHDLLEFLKTGSDPGKRNWAGVLGQSATSPLFFVVRELQRLGVAPVEDERERVHFVCTPVRRIVFQLGWIRDEEVRNYDFDSLRSLSDRLAAKVAEHDDLSKWHDIPFLHMDREGIRF